MSHGRIDNRLLIALGLALVVSSHADTLSNAFANLLAINTKLGPPSQTGSSSSNLEIAAGGTAFSQGGLIFSHGGYGMDFNGLFDNLQSGPLSPNYPAFNDYVALYDYTDGSDRIESTNGASAPLFLQPADGYAGVGPYRANPQIWSVGGNEVIYNPTSLASESLTNGTFSGSGTSWTSTNDCSFRTSSAICSFSAGTASTISQASGTLANAGVGNRVYRYAYTVSSATGSPSASITSAFANSSAAAPTNLDLVNGSHILYFQAIGTPGAFTITTTLTAGQAFTLTATSLKQITGGNDYIGGLMTAQTLGTATNCASSGGTCGSAAAGSVSVAAGATTVVVDTTAVLAKSDIIVTFDSSLNSKLGGTCNTTVPTTYGVSARTTGTSFTITATAPITNPACFNYLIVN